MALVDRRLPEVFILSIRSVLIRSVLLAKAPSPAEVRLPWHRGLASGRIAVAGLAALLLGPFELRAEMSGTAVTPVAGVWSKDLDTCSLTDDEDDTRIVIDGGEVRDYVETCRILGQSARQDGSVLMSLQCPGSRAVRTMRIFPRSRDSAVFYLPENKRPRSRDVIRCPEVLAAPLPDPEAAEKWNTIREPRRLIKLWLDARQRCRFQVSVAREEACTERRQIGALLRSMGMCHFTRGSREGWRACAR